MRIGLALYTNLNKIQNDCINDLSNYLENYFSSKYYGNDIREIFIGIICVKPEFNNFFRPRKLKYHKGIITKKSDHIKVKAENCVEYDIKLNFELFSEMSTEEIKITLSKEIVASISQIQGIKKIIDFNFEKFNRDIFKALLFN